MAAPTYISPVLQETTDAGGAWSVTAVNAPTAGNVVLVNLLQDGATNGAVAVTGATNIEDIAGNDNAWTNIPGPNGDGSFPVGGSGEARLFLYIGRALSTSLPSISGTNSTSEDLYVQMYQFSDVSTGTTLATVIENGSAGATANTSGTSATMTAADITTLGADRLGIECVGINDDNVTGAFTSPGTWSDPKYADAAGTDGMVGLQYWTISSATTVTPGTASITDIDAWGVVGFALIGTTVETTRVPFTPPYRQHLAQ